MSDPLRFKGGFSGRERNVFFVNPPGEERFYDVAYGFGLDFQDDGRAVLPIDYDGDGDLDLAISTLQGLRLVENTLPRAGRHYTRVRLRATTTEAQAYGAQVTVEAGSFPATPRPPAPLDHSLR